MLVVAGDVFDVLLKGNMVGVCVCESIDLLLIFSSSSYYFYIIVVFRCVMS